MPSIKELMTPQNVGIMIYAEVMPIPGVVLEQVEKAEKAFERLGRGGMPERAVRLAHDPEKTPRQRASINRDIVAFLSTEPLTMRTPRQVWSAIKSAYPKQTTETVQTRLKNNAGKPDLWIVAAGKYGLAGVTAATGNGSSAAGVAANLSLHDAVYAYIAANPLCTKKQVTAAMMASRPTLRPNHVGIALTRLASPTKAGAPAKIAGGKTGPYSVIPKTRVVTVPETTAGVNAGAPAPA